MVLVSPGYPFDRRLDIFWKTEGFENIQKQKKKKIHITILYI